MVPYCWHLRPELILSVKFMSIRRLCRVVRRLRLCRLFNCRR